MRFAEPMTNVLQMGLDTGMKVADLGSGSGHYAIAASGIVGPVGQVYAVDIQEDLLAHIRDKATEARRKNIETIWGDIERVGGTRLRDTVVDGVILSNVLFQLSDRAAALAEARRIMRPGAKLLVLDWTGSHGGIGPAEHLIISERDVEELALASGFHKVKSFPGGPHHYSLLFTLP
jgi:ubiquinone/menaquinone biosynthesis C-methylase UbiE